jgi:sugar porter (SP) family MFS transporter
MCAASGVLYGYNLGVIAGAILFIVDDFGLSATLKEIAISASLFGAMFGAIIGGKLADWIGRRRTIVSGAALGMIAALVGSLSTDIWLLISHRVFVGFSFGMLACVTPLFVAEVSPSNLRGRLGALFSVALMVGLLCSYLADFIFSGSALGWRWMFLLGLAPAVPVIATMLFLPESPRWLLARGAVEKARKAFRMLRGTPNVETEIATLQGGLQASNGSFSDLANPMFKMALIAGVGLAVIRQGTGVAISTFCSPELFQLAGFNSTTVDLLGTVGVGAVYVVMTLVALWLVDRLGRRPLMLSGLFGMTVGFALLFAVLQIPEMTRLTGWLAVAGLMLFVAAFAVGPGAVVFLLISEIYPQQIRGIGMGIANFALWGAYLLSTLTFPILLHLTGKSGPFLIYTLLGAAAWLFVYKVIPETKGRSLEEIQSRWQTRRTGPPQTARA